MYNKYKISFSDTTYLSVLRILAIYWVVLIQHNFAPFSSAWKWVGEGKYIYMFAPLFDYTKFITVLTMPLCFFISGYIMDYTGSVNKKSFKDFIWGKLYRILFPCYLFGAFFMVICNAGTFSFKFLLGFQHMWYLFYLFIFFVIFAQPLRKASNVRVIIILMAVLSMYYTSNFIPSNTLHGLLYESIYFILGVSASRFSYLLEYVKSRSAFFIIFVLAFIYQYKGIEGGYIAPVILMLLVIFRKMDMTKIAKSSLFKILNSTSYGVYIFHMIIQYVIYRTMIFYFSEQFIIDNAMWLTSAISITLIPLSILVTLVLKKLKI